MAHQRLFADGIVHHFGMTHAQAHHFGHLDLQLIGRAVVPTNGDKRIDQPGVDHGVQQHKGQIVGHVVAVLVRAADDQRGAGPAPDAAAPLVIAGVRSQLFVGCQLQVEELQQLLHEILCICSVFQGFLVEGIQILVRAAQGDSLAVALHERHHVDHIGKLHRFPEISGRLLSQVPAHFAHVQQLVLGLLAGIHVGLLLGKGRVSPEKSGDGVQHNELCVIELQASDAGNVGGGAQLFPALADMGLDAAQALLQAVFIVRRDVPHAHIHHDAGVENVHPACGGAALGGILGQSGQESVLDALSLPVFLGAEDLVSGFVVVDKGIIAALVQRTVPQLVIDPRAVFQINRGREVLGAVVQQKKLALYIVQRAGLHVSFQRSGLLDNDGLSLVFLIGGGEGQRPPRIQKERRCLVHLPDPFDAWIGRKSAGFQLFVDANAKALVIGLYAAGGSVCHIFAHTHG